MTNTLDCTGANTKRDLDDIIDSIMVIEGDFITHPTFIKVNDVMKEVIKGMLASDYPVDEIRYRGAIVV